MSSIEHPLTADEPQSLSYNIGTVLWCTFLAFLFIAGCALGVVKLNREIDEINDSEESS